MANKVKSWTPYQAHSQKLTFKFKRLDKKLNFLYYINQLKKVSETTKKTQNY